MSLGAGGHQMTGLTSASIRCKVACRPYTEDDLSELGIVSKPLRSAYTIVRSDVWIGDGAVVMPGLEIGTGAVIGANAVVTKDVPPYAVVAGTPARIIKFRFKDAIVEKLLASEWWELSIEKLEQFPIKNVMQFIDLVSSDPRVLEHDEFNTYVLDEA